jgi:biotin synthase
VTLKWTPEAVAAIYRSPLLELVYRAASVHRAHHDASEVQTCTLLSVKTGGCPEDCGYCPQSARHETGVKSERLMDVEKVLASARAARESGSTRFCMGAAWRNPKNGSEFDNVLAMVRGVRALGLEACCTLGMLTEEQARRLAEAGLTAYNHNLDTSAGYYDKIITTRRYEERLETLKNVARAGISACCGGILGMGESEQDRVDLLCALANLQPQPESVPINALVAVEGTPLQDAKPVEAFDFVRAVATARILMPKAMVRLSAGRLSLSPEAQALAMLAGANSIFTGEKLLTTPNPGRDADGVMLDSLGLKPRPPHRVTHDGPSPEPQPASR